jgi:23S rRNA (guanine745-N1)-methyltransferase
MAAVACDAWRALPLRDGAAAVVLSVFAPRDADELARVLAPGGTLVVATPTAAHLAELVTALGMIGVDPDKQARLTKTFGRRFETTSSTLVEAGLQLPRAHAALVAGMGPSAHHLDPAALAARVAELPDPVRATLSVTVRCLSSAG